MEVTGAKRRALQVWAERGVIQPIKSTSMRGTGVHRLFSRKEATIACLIHPFAVRQIAIGELHVIAMCLRGALDHTPKLLEDAIADNKDSMLIVYSQYRQGRRSSYRIMMAGIEIEFSKFKEPGSLVMAIRLETYLSKLK
jgi:hypothetical protein